MAAVLTAKGRDTVTSYLNAGTPTQPKVLGWGLNPGAATAVASDIALFKEAPESRTTGTSSVVTTTTTDDTYQVIGTFTAGEGQTVAEVAIMDTTTKPPSTTWATCPTSTNGTTGTLTLGTGFVSGQYVQDSSGEVMQLVTVAGTSVSGIVRGANGSTPVNSANGNEVTVGAIPGAALAGGQLFVHANFTGIVLTTSDSIAFTTQTKFV